MIYTLEEEVVVVIGEEGGTFQGVARQEVDPCIQTNHTVEGQQDHPDHTVEGQQAHPNHTVEGQQAHPDNIKVEQLIDMEI